MKKKIGKKKQKAPEEEHGNSEFDAETTVRELSTLSKTIEKIKRNFLRQHGRTFIKSELHSLRSNMNLDVNRTSTNDSTPEVSETPSVTGITEKATSSMLVSRMQQLHLTLTDEETKKTERIISKTKKKTKNRPTNDSTTPIKTGKSKDSPISILTSRNEKSIGRPIEPKAVRIDSNVDFQPSEVGIGVRHQTNHLLTHLMILRFCQNRHRLLLRLFRHTFDGLIILETTKRFQGSQFFENIRPMPIWRFPEAIRT